MAARSLEKALPLADWHAHVMEQLDEGEDRLVKGAEKDASYFYRLPASSGSMERRVASVLLAGHDEVPGGVLLVCEGPELHCVKALVGSGEVRGSSILVPNQNLVDFMMTCRAAAADSKLASVHGHLCSMVSAAADVCAIDGTIAGAYIRLGREPEVTGEMVSRIISAGRLGDGSVLVVLPSVSRLEERKGKRAVAAALQEMEDAIKAAGRERGYRLRVDEEAGDSIASTARVFTVVQGSLPRQLAKVAKQYTARELASGFLAYPGLLLQPNSRYCFVKRADDKKLKLHLQDGCNGATKHYRRSQVDGTEVCSICKDAAVAGMSLSRLLSGSSGSTSRKSSVAAPVPTPVKEREVPRRAAAVADTASTRPARTTASQPAAQPKLRAPTVAKVAIPVYIMPSGKKLHWSRECRYVVKSSGEGAGRWADLSSVDLSKYDSLCSICEKKQPAPFTLVK